MDSLDHAATELDAPIHDEVEPRVIHLLNDELGIPVAETVEATLG
jgi:hypothetical protein